MILVDTSVWVDYLRAGDDSLAALLNRCSVLIHPFVIGELACGNLRNRASVLKLLKDLPRTQVATEEEALFFIEQHQLMGLGIGYTDVHLLTATALSQPALLWTRDKRLAKTAATLKLAYET